MTPFTLLGLAAAAAGCSCVYLGSPQQRWRTAPWPAWPARGAGALLLATGYICMQRDMHTVTAVFAYGTVLMLLFTLPPYLAALLPGRRSR